MPVLPPARARLVPCRPSMRSASRFGTMTPPLTLIGAVPLVESSRRAEPSVSVSWVVAVAAFALPSTNVPPVAA
jgi:hypothetical protein